MNFLDKLNPEQREAVLHRDGPLLILAGRGLGEDARHHLSHRLPHRRRPRRARTGARGHVHEQGVAGDARARRGADRRRRPSGVWLSTFHSLCARLLRREAPKIGLSRDFVIYDSSDQVAVVKQAQRELGIDDKLVPPRVALSRISQAKNRMEGPETLRGGWNIRDEQIAKIYERYLAALKDANALDFDDLLLKTVELFETSEQTREFYAPQVQVRDGRRVPGHEPPAVPADPPARGGPPQHRRRRRSGSVDLQVARRRPAQHPRLRAGLRRGQDRPPRAELPLDADDPRRRHRRSSARTATARTSGCGPTARAARRSSTSAATTSSRKPTSSPARSSSTAPRTSTPRWRSSTAPTRSRGRSKIR